jgi:hypothetical protein
MKNLAFILGAALLVASLFFAAPAHAQLCPSGLLLMGVGPATCSGAPPTAPSNVSPPVISGTPQVGSTLTASNGTWTGGPTGFADQWLSGGSPISGATSPTYTPITGDIGAMLAVTVTATNGVGSTPATSAAVGPVTSCAQSQAFFTRAAANITAAGGAAAVATWVKAVDGLICGQVNGGTWSLKDVEYMLVAPTPQLAVMNLVSSSFTLSPGASMMFAANAGLTGVANLTGYADVSGYTPSSGQMTTATALMGVCVLNNRTTLMARSFLSEVGTQTSSNSFVIDILTGSSATQASLFLAGGSALIGPSSTTIPTTKGGFWLSRTSSASFNAFANGATLGTQSGTVPATTGIGDFFVLGLNNAGTPFSPGGLADTVGAVILGGGETATQVQADEVLFTTALHAMGISSGC